MRSPAVEISANSLVWPCRETPQPARQDIGTNRPGGAGGTPKQSIRDRIVPGTTARKPRERIPGTRENTIREKYSSSFFLTAEYYFVV